MKIGLFVLALVDIFAGLSFFFKPFSNYFIAGLILAKGIWSILVARPHFSLLGLLDCLTGVIIFLKVFGISSSLFIYFGLVVLIKGVYSLVFSF